jgi:hypothetical protein
VPGDFQIRKGYTEQVTVKVNTCQIWQTAKKKRKERYPSIASSKAGYRNMISTYTSH